MTYLSIMYVCVCAHDVLRAGLYTQLYIKFEFIAKKTLPSTKVTRQSDNTNNSKT